MSPFTIRRQINFEWVLTAILKLTIPEGWYQSKWYIQLQIKKSSGSPEGHFNTFKVLKYFWKCVQCRRSFITSVIIKAKRYWALKALCKADTLCKALLTESPNPQDYFIRRFYSCYFTDEKAEAEWTQNTLPKKTQPESKSRNSKARALPLLGWALVFSLTKQSWQYLLTLSLKSL